MSDPFDSTPPLVEGAGLARRMPSGRSVVLRVEGGEAVEIRGEKGDVEVRVVLTESGPVVTLKGARLEVESPEIAFRCQTFDVKASERVSLESGGGVEIKADEARVATRQDIHLNGAFIRLNCTPDGDPQYPPEFLAALAAQAAMTPQIGAAPSGPAPAAPAPDHEHHEPHQHGPGCAHEP